MSSSNTTHYMSDCFMLFPRSLTGKSTKKPPASSRPFPGLKIASSLGLAFLTAIITTALPSQQAQGVMRPTCQLSADEVAKKNDLRQAAVAGDSQAQQEYDALLQTQAERLNTCRNQNWPKNQAIWLRLYPCDARPGNLDALLDRIVNKGYNQVYVETFYDGQVLLPVSDNPTPWPSAIRTPGLENLDLLAEVIKKGRQRGLKVYAWHFTMNFGHTYAQDPMRQSALAMNGQGQHTMNISQELGLHSQAESQESHVFIDPYSPQARQDYALMISEVLDRQPDGMLFDYVRYLRGVGSASVVSNVQQLWIYSQASRETLYQRALNQKGRELIRRFVANGTVTTQDIADVNQLYSGEGEPLWQGRSVVATKTVATPEQLQSQLQWELWYLSVAHAVQGILDFVALAIEPIEAQGLPAGAVFFPGGNRPVGERGYDSRLQPWDRFPASMEFHPMAYANCGKTQCIVDEIQRVVSMASPQTRIIPALAGDWGKSIKDRPSLEAQMDDIYRRLGNRIDSVSHFAYAWQEPESERDRKFCNSN
ncbi:MULTISPECIES: family 10 glycosylhydrolase [Planktothricoides]|uniref:Family 10 glycosylhydrolase n=2 Tax=Planktothricoides raciborskii TaxID=132608 RepID=A0AAU8J9N5_9CYAN|nr:MULTISPECIES: family 10 glycosylhydrolase [Planktothricoides]